MRRVSVVGSAGVGESTLARRLAEVLGVPVLELDGVFHQAGWTRLRAHEWAHLDVFRLRSREEVEAFIALATKQRPVP